MANSIRVARVSADIQRTLARLLQQETKDPRLQNITLTEVSLSSDLSFCKVYLTQLGTSAEQAKHLIELLNKAKGYYKNQIGVSLKLRIVPELRFFYDEVLDQADHIDQLIKQALQPKA